MTQPISNELKQSWSSKVKEEVEKIKKEDIRKQRNLISSAWKSNRATIAEDVRIRSQETQPRVSRVPPVVCHTYNNSEESSDNSNSTVSAKSSGKRNFAKVTANDKSK